MTTKATRTSEEPTSEPGKDNITSTTTKVDKKPGKLSSSWRKSTVLIIVVLGIRFVFLVVVCSYYAIPIVYQIMRNLVSRPRKPVEYPNATDFFYPRNPHKLVVPDPDENIHAARYFIFCVCMTTGMYLGELLDCLKVVYGIFSVQRKNLRNSRKYCRNYVIDLVIALTVYIIAVIGFLISADFLFAYWIDFVTIPFLIYLMVKRMKLIELLIEDGIDTTLDLISVDSEKQLLPEPTELKKTAETRIKADPDYQNLFGNKKDISKSSASGSHGSGSAGGKSPLERDSIAVELTPVETSEVPSSVPSTVAPTDEEAHRDSNPVKKGKVTKKKAKKLKSDDDQGEHRDSNQSSNKSSNKGDSIKSKKNGIKKKS